MTQPAPDLVVADPLKAGGAPRSGNADDEDTPERGSTIRDRRTPPPRAWIKVRRWLGRLLLLAPGLGIVAVDLLKRHARIRELEGMDFWFYVLSAIVGTLLWAMLLAVATRTRGIARWPIRVLLVIAAGLLVGSQIYSYGRYAAYVNHRAVLVGTSFLPSVGQQLWFDRWTFARAIVPCIALAIALPLGLKTLAPLRERARGWLCLDIAVFATLVCAFVSPDHGAEQGQPPDVMYLSAIGQLARASWVHDETVERVHPTSRTPEPVAPIVARPAIKRNVVMIITESVRTQSVCLDYSTDCKWTPFSNAEAKERIALSQMRALDSTTAISLAIMWGGMLPTSDRQTFHTMPIIWEYTQAAKLESSYYTAQNLLFGNSGKWLGVQPWTRHVSGTQIEPDATYETGCDDGKLVDFALGDIGNLKEPYFAVVHLSNTHFPYKVDPAFMPFTPQEEATGPGYENEILNRYQDSIILQDKALGRFLAEYKKRPEAQRSVLMYVSDHGEQMREKGAVGHTGTLFEPEIRVPFWIDAPKGMLTETEEASLRKLHDTPVTQLDVFPTLMDLLGLWDAPSLDPFRSRIAGQSLLRGGSDPNRALVFTNCSELWACAFKNWGSMQGTKKLIAHQGEGAWNCFDVATDPGEEKPLDVSACGGLLSLTEKTMGGRPFGGTTVIR